MLKDVTSVRVLEAYWLEIGFEDGVVGVVNLAKLIRFRGVFAPLADRDFFGQVQVNPEIGSIAWPNEADLDPDVLYAIATGQPIALDRPLIEA